MRLVTKLITTCLMGMSLISSSVLADSLPTAELDILSLPGKSIWNGAAEITPLALNGEKKPSTVILQIPAGTQAKAAHATKDGNVRFAIVLSGTMYYADGDAVDKTKEKAYPAGSVLVISSGTRHWVSTRESDVKMLLTATAPENLTPFVQAQMTN